MKKQEKQPPSKGRGWRGDSEGHAAAGKKGGSRLVKLYGPGYMAELGRRGGKSHSPEHMAAISRMRKGKVNEPG